MTSKDTILMDGDCGLCTHTAVFLNPRLKQQYSIRFLAIESKEGQELISTFSEKLQRADSVYLIVFILFVMVNPTCVLQQQFVVFFT